MVSKNCEGCEIYTACHSYTGAGRRYKIPGSEREDFITHSKQQAASASCLHCVPLPPCPTGMRSSNAGRRYSCVAAQKLRALETIIFERGPQQICPIFAQRKTLYNLVQERKKGSPLLQKEIQSLSSKAGCYINFLGKKQSRTNVTNASSQDMKKL